MKPFDIIVYAIVAFALILVLLNVWNSTNPPQTLADDIQKGLEKAQSSIFLGDTVIIDAKIFPKDTTLSKGSFSTSAQNMSLAFECNSPSICCAMDTICNKPIEWNYTMIRFKQSQNATLSARCIIQDSLSVCRVYFGDKPAQAKIFCTSISEQDAWSMAGKLCVRNDGKENLAAGIASFKLLKKVGEEFVETGDEFALPEAITLAPGQDHNFIFDSQPLTRGLYRATFKFEGINAGFDTNSIDFEVGTNTMCAAMEQTPASTQIMADGNYMELHYCTGCNYSYECLAAWMAKNPSTTYEPLTKEATYCVKESYDASC